MDFQEENGHSTSLYGAKYKYMGQKATQVKETPPVLQKLLDKLNTDFTGGKYQLNSILVNRYSGEESYLPEHPDNEWWIDPTSSIFTISLGASRTMQFRNVHTEEQFQQAVHDGSLYIMSRDSQNVFKHRLEKDPEFKGKVRYSITVRCTHWKHLNSVCVVGDSNTKGLKFGAGPGTFGNALPGRRVEAIHIEDIDPEQCASYRNVVLVTGTNNLKQSSVEGREGVQALITTYRNKLQDIRKLNPRCRLLLVPVLPSRNSKTVDKIRYFNTLICNELVQHFSRLFVVPNINLFANPRTGVLDRQYDIPHDKTGLHLNRLGVSWLVREIKSCVFEAGRTGSKVHSNRSYSSAVTTGGHPR